MNDGVISVAWIIAGVLFIRSLGGLAQQTSARAGNRAGLVGMVLAMVATLFAWGEPGFRVEGLLVMAVAALGGGMIGAAMARRVEMTGMPELVAMLHSFVGLAAVLVGFATAASEMTFATTAERVVHEVEVWIGVAVGAITFTGSVVAWGKLRGSITGRPILLPGRHALNAALVLSICGLMIPFMQAHSADFLTGPLPWLIGMTLLAGALGVHLVVAIGGADMPVVVSLLNSYSGWAAAAAGFMLGNDLLILTGALVGSSGAILSIIMCRAMNRSILNVVFGGFGTDSGAHGAASAAPTGEVTAIDAEDTAQLLRDAREVIVVPGYGMAVARAQSAVFDLVNVLRERGVKVRFAIHPVAGRLPGHMNVLLAEAGVPYDIVLEMEEIDPDFDHTDVVLVIGANDIVNPGALDDPTSPIYGMPVLQCWKARTVIVSKRGMAAGYAGVENPLFYLENTRMLFGDAKKSVDAVVGKLRG